MTGAAKITTGNIVPHEKSHNLNQCFKKPSSKNDRLAIEAVIAQVRHD
jgi:hypothetical protein